MKKIIFFLIFSSSVPVALLTAGSVITAPANAAVGECNSYLNHSAQGIFINFQSHEYVGGFLNVHFKLNSDPTGSIQNTIRLLRSSDCLKVNNYTPYPFPLTLPSGIRNFSIRFYNFSGISTYSYRIYNDDTNLPLICPGCNVTFSTPVFFGFEAPHRALFNLRVNDVLSSSFVSTALDIQGQDSKTPVLIIPGVLGTDIKKGDNVLWANPIMGIPGNSDDFMDPLQFKEDLTPLDYSLIVDKVIGEKPFFDYTKSLIDEFFSQGYKEGSGSDATLFTFPYDWRYGVSGKYSDGVDNVDKLKQKIEEILSQTGSDKIDVIAHSTGGLLLKKYIMDNPASHKVKKAVMVGVPNLGAPKAVKVLVQGDNFDIFGLNDAEMKKISKNMPVVYDLAPARKLYDIKGSFVKVIEQKFLAKDIVKDLNYDEAGSFLLNDHGLNSLANQNTQDLQTNIFINYDMRSAGADVYNIVGCKGGTIGQIVEVRDKDFWGNPMITYREPRESTGDETVPFESADSIQADDNKEFYAKKFKHSGLLSANGTRQLIVNLIAGTDLNIGNKILTKPELLTDLKQCEIKGKKIEIQSPLNIEVIDQFGNRLGLAEDGSLQNDIPGADFNVFGEHKFVFLPEDEGEIYTINLKGTGEGTFTLGIDDVDGDNIEQSQNFINIPVSTTTLGSLDITSDLASMSLDGNGDGNIDRVIEPSTVLDENQSLDLISPISTSTLSGLMGQPRFYRSDVSITLSAIDPVIEGQENQTSGVLKIQYNLDNSGWSDYSSTTPIQVVAEGFHSLEFFSFDRAGNNEEHQIITFTIDKTAPEAIIQFNPTLKDLQFIGMDNQSTSSLITVLDNDNTIILKDQAGNFTEIVLKDKYRKKALRAEIKDIKYNGQVVDISKNQILFFWQIDKKGKLILLSQFVRAKKDFNILALYGAKNTLLTGRDESGRINQRLSGLVLLKISTDKGNFKWGY